MICTKKKCFSAETIKRLAIYLQNFKRLEENDIDVVSSVQVARLSNVTPEQFRKDLSYFGEFGKRGVGYETKILIHELEKIFGLSNLRKVAIVGVGKLGSSLLNYQGFSKLNINIAAAFDYDKEKIGSKVNDVFVNDISKFDKIINKYGIKICILSVPQKVAQEITNLLVKAGIRAILNFAPVGLNVPENVYVTNMDIYSEIERLIYFLNIKD